VNEVPFSSYVCGPAARWLPRALSGSVLTAGLLAVARLGGVAGIPMSQGFRLLLMMLAAAAALWIVRRGGEVRIRVSVAADGVVFEAGSHRACVFFEKIRALRFEGPFGPSRSWLSAAVIVDNTDREWRLSGLLARGERLIDEIVRRSGREDLGAWVEAHAIRDKMARAALRVRAGYTLALGVVTLAAAYSLS
jgi:hypothetical protein